MGKSLGERVKLRFKEEFLLNPASIRNEKDAIKFAKQAISYAKHLQAKRSASPYFRKKEYSVPSLHSKHTGFNKELLDKCAEATLGYAIKTLYKSPQPLILDRTHKN